MANCIKCGCICAVGHRVCNSCAAKRTKATSNEVDSLELIYGY